MHPEASPTEIDEAIQIACDRFLTKADGITEHGQVYTWLRITAHRELLREDDRRKRLIVVDPAKTLAAVPTDEFDPEAEAIAPRMRELMLFAAFQLMRPSELYALKESHIDFKPMRIRKQDRIYKGKHDVPKTGVVTVALTRPALNAITRRPTGRKYVFMSKTGKPLSQATLSGYWAQVKARAGLDFDFYHATKHYGVHYMWTVLELSPRAIAAIAGWKSGTIMAMLETYGHADVGAFEEVDAAFGNHQHSSRSPLQC